jgi:integrase
LIPVETAHAICAIRGLRQGQSKAREPQEIQPVATDIVEKTLPHCPPVIRDMIRIQQLGGWRPQDIINLRSCDIDRSKTPWKYTPYTHKTKRRGKIRELAIGPRARAILTPYLMEKEDSPEDFIFSPIDSMKLVQAERRRNRKTKVQPSQQSRKKTTPKRSPGKQYTTSSYNRAINKACKKAGVPPWHPNQLRHTKLTEIREDYSPDCAQAVGGHSSVKTTEIYAKVSFDKAAKVMEEIG